ncbi:MAG: hemolysin family protein [Candidatus Gastranaerophilales bacterium]|nr:hemolysin family protein [Candidatus Gastranaerophilales bacterium]MCM1073596.1 hemolysin family protein [Bacteroides sp.]
MDLTDILINIFVIAFLLFVNGFFVAAEFALVKVRKTRLEQLSNEGNSNAKKALKLVNDTNKMLAAAQLGVTIASIALGWVAESTIVQLIEPVIKHIPALNSVVAAHAIAVPISFVVVTYFHVLLGEQLPKCFALRHPDSLALWVARPMDLFITLFKPFVWLLLVSGDKILCAFHVSSDEASLVHSTEELDMLVDASYNEGVLNETEAEMLHNMFKFSDLLAKQVMLPRTDMMCIPSDISYEELNKFALENQYTRYPVYEGSIDKILGFIHVKDLYSLAMNKENYSIDKLIRPLMLVPETMTLDNLILEFKKTHTQMAVVIDEFGGTSGLITLEDVLEEIIGEVQDEFDEEEEVDIKEIAENTYIANAMMRIDELVDFFDLNEAQFEEDDVETIAGLVVKLLGRIAIVGDKASFNGLTFTVVEVDGARVTKLEVYKEPVTEAVSTSEEN